MLSCLLRHYIHLPTHPPYPNPTPTQTPTPTPTQRFGDWLRYGSFVLISGGTAPAAYFPLAWTMLFNLASLKERDAGQAKRGEAAGERYLQETPAVVPWRLLF